MHLKPSTPTLQYSISLCRLFEAPDGIDVVRGSSQPRFHGVESYMSGAESFPSVNFLYPPFGSALPDRNPSFYTNKTRVPSGFTRVGMDLFNCRPALIVGS